VAVAKVVITDMIADALAPERDVLGGGVPLEALDAGVESRRSLEPMESPAASANGHAACYCGRCEAAR